MKIIPKTLIFCILAQVLLSQQPQQQLVFPTILEKEERERGNPLATYAAMLDLEPQYLKSKIFANVYPEIKRNFEEFLGFPVAGTQALSLPPFKKNTAGVEKIIPPDFKPESALRVIEREADKTKIVIFGEEHHLPQTRSLYEGLLRRLWKHGYRYLAAESFDDEVMSTHLGYPTYATGLYTLDPIYASAFRTAREMGYKLVAYDTKERGPNGDQSFRDRTQAENIKKRTFDIDPNAKVVVFAGRGHAAESMADDGWTPMASVLKKITGIDPLTLYAPAMTERLTRDEEDPLYRFATSHGIVNEPTIFVDKQHKRLFGSQSFDAYIFWPRPKLEYGRPDWMRTTLGRHAVAIPDELRRGQGMRLVQAYKNGEPAEAVPVDQIVLTDDANIPALMLPKGHFWARSIDRYGTVLARTEITVR